MKELIRSVRKEVQGLTYNSRAKLAISKQNKARKTGAETASAFPPIDSSNCTAMFVHMAASMQDSIASINNGALQDSKIREYVRIYKYPYIFFPKLNIF